MGLSADTLKVGKQAVRQGDLTIRLRGSAKLTLLLVKPYQLPAQLDKRLAGDVVKDVRCAYSVRSGDFVAVKLRDDGRLQTLSVLDKLGEVSASAWIGTTAVNYGGRTYTVPSDVLCWNRDGGSWLDGGAEAALAYGGTMNLYVKDGVVRVIEVRS